MKMNLIKHITLDSETYADAVKSKVVVTEIEDLTGKVDHVGFGGASKSYYELDNGAERYVLERNGMSSPDSYTNNVWIFYNDFTANDAYLFLKNWDSVEKEVGAEISAAKAYIKMTETEKKEYYAEEKELAEKEAPAIIDFFDGWLEYEEFDRIKKEAASWSEEEVREEVIKRTAKKLSNH